MAYRIPRKISPAMFFYACRWSLLLGFMAGGAYLGWWKLLPVPAIAIGATLVTLLLYCLKIDSSWGKNLRRSFVGFWLAEIFCLIGIHGCYHCFPFYEISLSCHDLLHVVSFYFLWLAAYQMIGDHECPLGCCSRRQGWREADCDMRNLATAMIILAVIFASAPIFIWAVDHQLIWLVEHEESTAIERLLHLVIFPGFALSFFIALFIMVEVNRQLPGKKWLFLLLVALSCLTYSLFQLSICLVMPELSIAIEEFLEFAPMVPIWYFLLGKLLPGPRRKEKTGYEGSTSATT